MILFTSGFPKSGKTTLSKLITKELKHVIHINPSDYYPDDFAELPSEEKMEIATTAWEMSLEKATKSICALPNRALIIFDTCCSKSLHMRPLFINSKVRGHRVIMVYVDASLEKRVERTKDQKLIDLEERYGRSFKETLPILKGLSDEFTIIGNNSDDLSELHKYAQLACKTVESMRSG